MRFRMVRFTPGQWLFIFFLFGMVFSSLFFYWRYPSYYYQENVEKGAAFGEIFCVILKQRLFQLILGWICGLTCYSLWLFGSLTSFWSFSLGMGIAGFTAEKGLLGLPLFLFSLMPQGLIYFLVWYILFRWSVSPKKNLRLIQLVILGLFVAAGAALEAYIRG